MLKKLAASAIALFSLATFSLAAVNFDNPKANNLEIAKVAADIPVPVEPSKIDKRIVKEWTIMVFVNAKNNLEPFGIKDLNEMEMVGSNDRMNVVVQLGRMGTYSQDDGGWAGARRYYVVKDSDPRKVSSKVMMDMGATDMGDYRNLADFGIWAKQNFPAKKYMLIVWNHGAGWLKGRRAISRGISYDEETGNHISTPQLGQAMMQIGFVDVYGSDACLMQMAEVIYEIMPYTKYIVGSEETEPGDGYTYNEFLAPLAAKTEMTPEEFGRVAVNAYADHYQSIKEGSTQSLIRTSAIPYFLKKSNEFAYAVTNAGDKALVKEAVAASQAFAYEENKDMFHFVQLVMAASKDPAVKQTGEALLKAINPMLVMHNRTTNGAGGSWWSPPTNYANAHGLAVYLPGTFLPPAYNELKWAKYSNWDEFINWMALP